MFEILWTNLSRETASKQKSRKEAQRTSESSNHSSQGPSRSKSPKQRRPSIFPKPSSFRRGSIDCSGLIKGQKYSPKASRSSPDVTCSHAKVESSKEGYDDRESTCPSGYHTSYASECFCKRYYRQNQIVNDFEVRIEHPSTSSLLNRAVRWRAPESWGYISDLEFNQDPPPPLSSFAQEETDIYCPYQSAYYAPHSMESDDPAAE